MAERKKAKGAAADSAADEVESLDRALVAGALEKQKLGVQPNRQELSALKRWHKARDEKSRWHHYRTIPQVDWIKMSGGRHWKTLREQARRYGIPFADTPIDLPAVVVALHDFLATNAFRLAGENGEDALLGGANSPALERYREARAKLAELDLQEREKDLLPAAEVHEMLVRLSTLLRNAGETLQRQYGPDAVAIYDGALDDFNVLLDRRFGVKGNQAQLPISG